MLTYADVLAGNVMRAECVQNALEVPGQSVAFGVHKEATNLAAVYSAKEATNQAAVYSAN
jgi:hypothetical protein